MQNLRCLIAIGLVACGLAAVGGADTPRGEEAPAIQLRGQGPPVPLVAPGPAPDVEILFSSEVLGYYEPCG
jgi:hypothetical protein